MNADERKECSYFPKALDQAVNEKFGAEVECTSTYNIIHMTYITTYKAKGAKKKDIQNFIDGYLAGNEELGNRLYNLKKA